MTKEKSKTELEEEVVELEKENTTLKKKIAAKDAYAKSHKDKEIANNKSVQH